MAIEEGKPAPAFTLKNEAGEDVSLEDFRGQHVIVYFYPKDDTPGCTKEAQGFRMLWKKIQKEGAVVLGISPDSEASHHKFAKKQKLPFPLLSDPDRSVMTEYGAWGEKIMYGKKRTGVIRSTVWVDPEGKVQKRWKKVSKAGDHPAKVLEALQSRK
jgi:peroxiredoxin Q/BCP